jgi:PsbP-like protein
MRKKYIVVIIAVILLAVFIYNISNLLAESAKLSQTQPFQTYTNNPYGFSINYPTSWQVKENYHNVTVVFYTHSSSDVAVLDIDVVTNYTNGNSISGTMTTDYVKNWQSIGNFTLISTSNTTLAGYPAVQLEYLIPDSTQVAIFMIARNRLYTLVYGATGSDSWEYLQRFLPLAQNMTSSFKLS